MRVIGVDPGLRHTGWGVVEFKHNKIFHIKDGSISPSTKLDDGQRLFEIKFVEHEVPFYQLGNTYVYELQCELFEYNDETIDTGIDAIDSKTEDLGVITDLTMNRVGSAATATATTNKRPMNFCLSSVTSSSI